jgi:hypothetical protein
MSNGAIIRGDRYEVLYSYGKPVAYIDRHEKVGYETKTWFNKKVIKHIDYFFRRATFMSVNIIMKVDQDEIERSFKLWVECI